MEPEHDQVLVRNDALPVEALGRCRHPDEPRLGCLLRLTPAQNVEVKGRSLTTHVLHVEDEAHNKKPGKSRYISQKESMMERISGSQVKESILRGQARAVTCTWWSI